MKNVQMILNKEAQLVKELEAVKIQKEEMAVNALADAKEILKALNCEYLLNSNTTIERPVNITINKGKVTQLVKEKEVVKKVEVVKEVKDNTEIERLEKENKALIAEIEKLKKTVATYQRKDAEQRKEIEELKANITIEETQQEENTNEYEDDAYLEYLAQQEEEMIEEKQEEVIVGPQYVKKSPAIFKNNAKAKIYQTESCYLIASPTTNEITWMSQNELSEEYKKAVEAILIRDYKFSTNRQVLSPVVIDRENAYMARVGANQGFEKFSMTDVLSGYVKVSGKFYLYSYVPASGNKVFMESLDKKIVNSAKTMPPKEVRGAINNMVLDMYKEYKALTNSIKEEERAKEQEAADRFNANQEAIRKQREIDEAIIAASGINLNNNKKEDDNKARQTKALSLSLQSLADEF